MELPGLITLCQVAQWFSCLVDSSVPGSTVSIFFCCYSDLRFETMMISYANNFESFLRFYARET